MDTSFLNKIIETIEIENENSKRLDHKDFINNLLELIDQNPSKFKDEVSNIHYEESKNLILCQEPITFINQFDDISENQDMCITKFNKLIDTFESINIGHIPSNNIWFNTSQKGINLRPGLLDNEKNSPNAIKMGDESVHGVVVGRTGSGKSVFLNNLIFNLLAEYPPWEIDIYLADFKKIELSRYMTKYKTPHVKACAATSEIRYVISLISYIVECMYARQNLFARLGIQKISDFRDRYKNVVLPRTILIVDEFQQLFLEATNKESNIIQELLMSIIKLGRATGFHLIFASQEMTGALTSKALANFKIRFALPCEADVSSSILGNSEAANLEIGNVYVNTSNGKISENKLFRVPFIKDDSYIVQDDVNIDGYFYSYIKNLIKEQENYKFNKNKKYYQEDSRKDIKELSNILNKICSKRSSLIKESENNYFEIITLGESVVYNDRKIDLETFFLERGKNKNICVISTKIEDLAYMQKLFVDNFITSPREKYDENRYKHVYFGFNQIIRKKYNIENDIEDINIIEDMDILSEIDDLYNQRNILIKSILNSATPHEFITKYYTSLGNYRKLEKVHIKQMIDSSIDIFRSNSFYDIANICEGLDENYGTLPYDMMYLYENKVLYKDIYEIIEPYIIWISGIDNVDKLSREFTNILKNSLDVNLLFIVFSTSDDMNVRTVLPHCDYVFASGNDPKIYDRCGITYTNKSRESVVIDFKIKSMNTERSFKKYKFKLSESIVASIDFDEIIGDSLYE